MSLVKDVAEKFANFKRSLLRPEPASDTRTAETDQDDTGLPTSYDLTRDSPESEPQALLPGSVKSTVNQTRVEYLGRIERSKVADQENRTKNTSATKLSVQSQTEPSTTRNRDDRRSIKRDKASPEERRALGLPEKKPRDAVTVGIPTSPFDKRDSIVDNMVMIPRRHIPNQPFRPVNTLDAQPKSKSQRAEFYDSRMGITASQVSKTQVLKRSKSSEKMATSSARENNHRNPNKRLRVGSPFLEGTAKHHAIDLDEHQAKSPLRQPSTSYPGLSEEQWIVKPEEKPRKYRSKTAGSAQRILEPVFYQSEDELYDEQTESFNKVARKQRLEEERAQHEANSLSHNNIRKLNQLDRILDSSPSSKRQQPTTSECFENKSPAFEQVRPPDESPDALQIDTHMIDETPSRQKTSLRNKRASSIAEQIIASSRQPAAESHKSKSTDEESYYPLKSVIHPEVVRPDGYYFVLNHTKRSLSVEVAAPLLGDSLLDIAMTKITKIEWASGTDKMIIHFSGGLVPANRIPLEFSSEKSCADCLHAMQRIADTKLANRNATYMDKAFLNGPKRMEEYSAYVATKSPRRRSQDLKLFPAIRDQQKLPFIKKQRLVDKLDPPPITTGKAVPSATIITGADRAGQNERQTSRRKSPPTAAAHNDTSSELRGLRTPRTARATRSQISNGVDHVGREADSTPSRPDVCKGMIPWKQPLVYPANGKNCATIAFDDLKRLNDDEFLNDNLVGLFLRYLQEHASPDAIKRMHFFNTFFFESLTKERKTKGGINYEAVSKWTKKINIFKRDFVIVPVNENLHWFVMIICNLPRLKKVHDLEDQGEETDDVEEIVPPGTVRDEPIILTSDLPQSISETAARESFQEMSLDENTQGTPRINRKRERKGKPKRSLPKYDIDAPVIITLDSLDQPRSGTATALRSYIQALAGDERQAHQAFQVDARAEIKGMTGKGIPHQTNFSDCGLYLCMYLEQFMADPTKFVQRILRREESEQGWPTHIESGALRDRLLEMVVELHKEQESKDGYCAKIPSIGSILVNMQIDEAKQKHQQIMLAKARYERYKTGGEVEVLTSSPQRMITKQPDNIHAAVQLSPSESGEQVEDRAIIIDEDDADRSGSVSRYFQRMTNDPSQETLSDTTIPVVRLDTPSDMATRIRRERSPEGGHTDDKSISETASDRNRRHVSVSTDFLSGDDSFQMNEFPEVVHTHSQADASRLLKSDKDRSRHGRMGQESGDAHGHEKLNGDGLHIAHEMLFNDGPDT